MDQSKRDRVIAVTILYGEEESMKELRVPMPDHTEDGHSIHTTDEVYTRVNHVELLSATEFRLVLYSVTGSRPVRDIDVNELTVSL